MRNSENIDQKISARKIVLVMFQFFQSKSLVVTFYVPIRFYFYFYFLKLPSEFVNPFIKVSCTTSRVRLFGNGKFLRNNQVNAQKKSNLR